MFGDKVKIDFTDMEDFSEIDDRINATFEQSDEQPKPQTSSHRAVELLIEHQISFCFVCNFLSEKLEKKLTALTTFTEKPVFEILGK